ncbi:MAG: DUF4199 domain-containing protein [Mucilaginibacter sp.]|uniref:DUF4199 domain-containing protein n=1 Tax=Mucilaginibacter sp. TaxID=1882438 RepID=UPI00326787B9
MMETLEQKIRKNAVTNGLIFGVIFLVLGIFLFYFVTSMTNNFWMITIVGPIGITFLIPLAISIWLCFDLRKKIGGFWNFRQATTGIFIMFFVSYLLSTIGSLGFGTFIEPDQMSKMKTVYASATSDYMKKQGVDQEKIDKQTADMESKFEDNRTPGKLAKGLGIAIIIDFVIALIYAAFFKKEKPLAVEGLDPDEGLDPTV